MRCLVGRFRRFPFLVVVVAFVLLYAGCGGGSVSVAEIAITSDRSVMFTDAGQKARVSAVVLDGNGDVVEDATVRWSSSDPGAVAVTEAGDVTAMTSLGSAVLTAEYEGLANIVTAVVVTLRPEAVLVPTEDVVSVADDRSEIELRRTPSTEALVPGEVVVNGNEYGFLSRVLEVKLETDVVRLQASDVTIPEAVLEMELSASSPALVFEEEVEQPDTTAKSTQSATAALTLTFECKLETMIVNVGFEGFNITPKLGIQHQIVYRVRNGTLSRFEAALVGDVGVDAKLAALTLAGGVKGKVTCEAELGSVTFAAVPILGPVALSANATPVVGIELEAQYAAATLTINGVVLQKGERIRAGFGYDESQGYFLIGENQTTTDSVELGQARTAQEDTMSAKVEPFLGLNFGIGVLVGPALVVRTDIVTAKVVGGFELAIDTPLDYENPTYTGPRWNVFVGAEADVSPLLSNINVLGRRLRPFGLEGLESLIGVEVKLFELRTPLVESPMVTLTATPMTVDAEDPVGISVNALRGEENNRVESWAFMGNGGKAVATGRIDAQQAAMLEWTPSIADEGTHTVTALVFDDLFGAVDLPYASRDKASVRVTCAEPGCEPIDPDPPGPNPCLEVVDEETGRTAFRAGMVFNSSYATREDNPTAGTSYEETGTFSSTWNCHPVGAPNCVVGWHTTGSIMRVRTTVDGNGEVTTTTSNADVDDLLGQRAPWGYCQERPPGDPIETTFSGSGATWREVGEFATTSIVWSLSGCGNYSAIDAPQVAPAEQLTCCRNVVNPQQSKVCLCDPAIHPPGVCTP